MQPRAPLRISKGCVLLAQSFLLGVRMEGLAQTLHRSRARLFGAEEWHVFARPLNPADVPVGLPFETNGVTLRHMEERDVDEVARLLPFDLYRRPFALRRQRVLDRLANAIIATRADRIVGAAWYMDNVVTTKLWYQAARSRIVMPARLTSNLFAVPGEKHAGFAISKFAGEWLAARGVCTIVSQVRADNKPSLLIARLSGGKLVARVRVRYCFGRRQVRVVSVDGDES